MMGWKIATLEPPAASEGRRTTVGDVLGATYTNGFLVLHRGRIVMERYFNGMTEDTLHLSQSVSKSLVGKSFCMIWLGMP